MEGTRASAYRYPGSRPFEDTDIDRKLFFGREQEKEDLLQKVLAKKLVVLYAKSGLGKTSLINAGMSEGLREKGFVPLKVRFNNPGTEPVETVFRGIRDRAEQLNLDVEPGEEKTLWQYFKTAAFWSKEDSLMTPVLILDQFEEFFTFHKQEARGVFISQLADLVNGTIPSELRRVIQEGESFSYGEEPPNVKILISIRGDFLGHLDDFTHEIPDILQNRFRLKALTRDQAREAITKPSQVEDDQIGTHRFSYSEDALNAMLDYLSKHKEKSGEIIKDEVESFQLQLLCQHIESNIAKQAVEKTGQTEYVIKKEDLGGEPGMQKVLQNFYENQLSGFNTQEEKNRVRQLCEKGLISVSNRRLSLEEEEIERQFKVSPSLLAKLVDNRLLRAEKRVGSVYYELSHDSLITPIRLSQKGSPQENEINKLYKEAREYVSIGRNGRAIEIYKKILEINKTHIMSYIELGQLLAETWMRNDAIELYKNAVDNGVNDHRIYTNLGKQLFKTGKEDEALKYLNKAITLSPENADVYETLGDLYFNKKDFKSAITNYEKALEINNKSRGAYERLAVLYVEKGETGKAIEVYKRALKADTNLAGLYEEIADALKQKDDTEALIKLYGIALNVKSDDAVYYFGLGYEYAELGKNEEGMFSYQKALDLKPDYAEAYYNMGNSLLRKVDHDAAITSYKKALELKPDYAEAYNNMGVAQNAKGDYDAAIASYKKALELKPDFLSAKMNLAELYLTTERFDESEKMAGEVLKEKSVSQEYFFAMKSISISILTLQSHHSKALKELHQLISYYRGLTKEYDRDWNYGLIKKYITEAKRLNNQDKTLLFKMIDLLEAPKSEGNKILTELESLMAQYGK